MLVTNVTEGTKAGAAGRVSPGTPAVLWGAHVSTPEVWVSTKPGKAASRTLPPRGCPLQHTEVGPWAHGPGGDPQTRCLEEGPLPPPGAVTLPLDCAPISCR